MKNILPTYFSGVKLLFIKWKAWLIVLVCNMIFALLIARPFGSLLDTMSSHSEASLIGLLRFDFNFIADVINNYGTALHVVAGQAIIFAILYLILNIFLSGGLIECYLHVFEPFEYKQFWSNCAKHFWRLFRLALYFVGAQVVVLAACIFAYMKLGLSPFELESDGDLIFRTRIFSGIFIVLMAWMDMVNEYAKVKVVTQREKNLILPLIVKVKYFCLQHFFPMLILFLLCVASFLLVLGLYAVVNNIFVMKSLGTIILALIVGQLYLFLRIGTRLLFTSTAVDYMRAHQWGDKL